MKKNNTIFIAVVLVLSVIWIGSCSKKNELPPVSIVGVWTQDSIGSQTRTQGILTYDSTLPVSGTNATVLTFTSAGTFRSQPYSFAVRSGTYSYENGTLMLVDSGNVGGINFHVANLTSHSLLLQLTDTSSRNPLVVTYQGYNFAR